MNVLARLEEQIEKATPEAFGRNKRAVLFGTTDSAEAARQISDFVAQALATRISEVIFVKASSACAAGLMLSDGRKVFLKIHAGELDIDQLKAAHQAQDFLREKGIPTARLILAATDFGNGKLATVHGFRDRGDRLRAYHKGAIRAAATALAELISAGRAFPQLPSVPDMFVIGSNPLASRAAGIPEPPPLPPAERATAIVKAVTDDARALSGEIVISHLDWASRNLRFSKDGVSSVFDFEALRRGVEPLLVGHAAIDFINEPSGVRDPAAAARFFVDCYEKAAGYAFEDDAAAALDIGVALAVSRFCRSVVRSEGMRDEDAPRIFQDFMRRFRAALGREYAQKPYF
jgi:Ser/Thr protein kinase RdoA (MazF antagonist)